MEQKRTEVRRGDRTSLSFREWKKRVDILLNIWIGRTTDAFGGVDWCGLHAKGCRVVLVAEAVIEEWEKLQMVEAQASC